MTVIFADKYDGKKITHDGVASMDANDVCFGVTGYGLHFIDNTYCLVSSETYELVKVQA